MTLHLESRTLLSMHLYSLLGESVTRMARSLFRIQRHNAAYRGDYSESGVWLL